jgi:flagellar biosynthesis/type III secretory pathway M-ring protein FliF/YscJ
MADGLTFSGLRDAYAAASPARKLVWGVVIMLLLALPAMLLWHDAQAPEEYRVLFAKLSDKDGGEVVEALEKLQIPYRLSEPDGSVQVPADQLHAARYKLAAQGLPKGDRPATEENGPRFGLSPFQEQLGYQRRLEAELARSVEAIDAVESARVHLALPKQSAFLRDQVPPAASVLVKLKPGSQLSEEGVESVRQIVAGSVPGMMPGGVSIVDQQGALLAAGLAGFYRGLNANQVEYARQIENDLAGRISRVLEPVLGDTAFKVQVTARINFNESEETTETSRRTGTVAGSVDRTVRHVREPRGSLQQVSALIVVDERAGQPVIDQDRLAALARQVIGFDSARGDALQVIALPFTAEALPQPQLKTEPPRSLPLVRPLSPPTIDDELLPVYAGLALSLLAFLLLLVMRASRRRQKSLDEALAAQAPHPGELFEARLDALRQQVLADPKVAASVVKLWMQNP